MGQLSLGPPKLAFLTPPKRPLSQCHLPPTILQGGATRRLTGHWREKEKKNTKKRSVSTRPQTPKKNLRDPTTHRRLLPKIERSARSNGRTDVLWLATLRYILEMRGLKKSRGQKTFLPRVSGVNGFCQLRSTPSLILGYCSAQKHAKIHFLS